MFSDGIKRENCEEKLYSHRQILLSKAGSAASFGRFTKVTLMFLRYKID